MCEVRHGAGLYRAPRKSTRPIRLPTSVRSANLPPMRFHFGLGVIALTAWLIPTVARADPAPASIRPGEIWPDDRGQMIQAHGGGITRDGDTFYWFGEDRSPDL